MVAIIVGLLWRDGAAERKRRPRPGATCVFPFGLTRQSHAIANLGQELLAILPTDLLDRQFVPLESTRVAAHYLAPLRLRHLGDPKVERLADHAPMLLLVLLVAHLTCRRPHQEFARRDQHQLDPRLRMDHAFGESRGLIRRRPCDCSQPRPAQRICFRSSSSSSALSQRLQPWLIAKPCLEFLPLLHAHACVLRSQLPR